MPRLTNGTFKYTRRVKPGDPNEYNAPFREATAEISWSSSEYDDDIAETLILMNNARDLSVQQVHQMLGQKPVTGENRSTLESVREESAVIAPSVSQGRVEVAAFPASSDMMALETKKRGPGRPRKEPAQEEPSVTLQTEPASTEEDLLDDPTLPAVVEISTKDLLEAITRKNAERMARPEGHTLPDGRDGRSVQLIRDLIGSYVQLPLTARDIPTQLRQKFLSELKDL